MKDGTLAGKWKALLLLGALAVANPVSVFGRTGVAGVGGDAQLVKKSCKKKSDEGCTVDVTMTPAPGGGAGTYCVSITVKCGSATCVFNSETSPELCEVSGNSHLIFECDGSTINMGPTQGKTWKDVAGNCAALYAH